MKRLVALAAAAVRAAGACGRVRFNGDPQRVATPRFLVDAYGLPLDGSGGAPGWGNAAPIAGASSS